MELKIGHYYEIKCDTGDPDTSYFGPAELLRFNPEGYDDGVMEFSLGWHVLHRPLQMGYFTAADVVREITHEGPPSMREIAEALQFVMDTSPATRTSWTLDLLARARKFA